MHHTAAILASITAIWFVTVLVPGPNFLLTTRVALTNARATGLRAVLGIACSTTLWGLAGFFGVHALFTAAPWLYLALKLSGGIYLAVLGTRMLVASFGPHPPIPAGGRMLSTGSAFRRGLLTGLANPKMALFTTSLFAATMPPHPLLVLGIAAVAIMVTLDLAWYGFVACALTTRRAAAAFLRLRHWIDRLAGLAFVAFGAHLALER